MLRNIKILLVDDNKSIRKLLGLVLASDGYEIITAKDGEQALKLIKEVKPQILITDISMPQMDGMELLKKINHDPELYTIVITGYATIDKAVNCLKLGAVDFICKPFKKEQLLKSVQKIARLLETSYNQSKALTMIEEEFLFSIPNDIYLVPTIINKIIGELEQRKFCPSSKFPGIKSVLGEVLSNAIYYENIELSKKLQEYILDYDLQDKPQEKSAYINKKNKIDIKVIINKNTFECKIKNELENFNWKYIFNPTFTETLNQPDHDTMIISTCMDKISFNKACNEITLCLKASEA